MKLSALIVPAFVLLAALEAEGQALTPKALDAALAAHPAGAAAETLAGEIRTYFGGAEAVTKGAAAKIDELAVAWAIDAPVPPPNGGTVRVVADVGGFVLPLTRVGETTLYAGVATLAHGTAMSWHYEVGDRRAGGGQLEAYETHPDSREHPGVPKGALKQMPAWESRIFEGTTRDWWVYVPAQYKPENPAAVMVFQDGAGYKDFVPTVFDNLIARGDMPATVGIFIQPGSLQGRPCEPELRIRHALRSVCPLPPRGDPAGGGKDGEAAPRRGEPRDRGREQRRDLRVHGRLGTAERVQQGGLVDRQLHQHRQRRRPSARAGTTTRRWCARRRKNRSAYSSRTAKTISTTPTATGRWPIRRSPNRSRSPSYDYRFELGHGFHSNRHGRAIFPDTLRWLWRDYQP